MAIKRTGGSKLRRFLRQSKENMSRRAPEILVGFLDRTINPLALQLEYGNPDTSLPERPAFRQGIEDLRRQLPAIIRKALSSSSPARDGVGHITSTQAAEIARAARDILRASYERFEGPGLSERQARRKEGTPGADKELIGHEGPKLLAHLQVSVNGQIVG